MNTQIKRGRKVNPQPAIMRMGIIPRKLTRKEAKEITAEVMDSGIKDPDLRFRLAVLKTIDRTNKS